MRILSILLFLSITLCITLPAWGQKHLALENVRKFKRITYGPGDLIRFQVLDDKTRYHGIIESVNDSLLIIVTEVKTPGKGGATYRDYVPINNIRTILPIKKGYWEYFRRMYYAGTMASGSALIGIGVANGIIEHQTPDFDSMVIVTGLMTSGLIVRYIGRDKYKIKKRWRLRAIWPYAQKKQGRQ